MAVVATQLKKGQCIEYKGEQGLVIGLEHRTPGKGNALVMATIRSFASGRTKDIRFASSDKVDVLSLERVTLEFNYADAEGFHFMDPNTFEMTTLSPALLEGNEQLLTENLACDILYVEDKPVSVELPSSVELKVVEAAEGMKGDTANNPTKPAKLETGLEVQVPLFVKEGDVLKISTETKKYMSRA
ncbi:MAG: elongation factor P [Verrucomicrobia bacterium]|jgi:elongation factor P|nr:elongation factor P [Verrucomicrobiota bacterium]